MAWNEDNLDSAAAYCRVPLASAVDVASQDRQDGIQYRVGVYQVGARLLTASERPPRSQVLRAGAARSPMLSMCAVAALEVTPEK